MKLLGDVIPDRSSFEPMSALDASFLAAETRHTPMHIGSLTLFEGAPFFDERGRFRLAEVQAHVAGRMSRIPNFRRRMATPPFGQGRPVWVDATDFDISDHVRLRILPEPGSRQELADLCSRLYAEPLDRAHPLWQLCFVGGLDDGNVAMVERVHHSLIDGISGVEVAAALLDTVPDPEAVEAPPWTPIEPPGPLALALEGVWRDLTAAFAWGRTVRSMLAGPAAVGHRVQGLVDGVASVLAPRQVIGSSVNAEIGDRRHLEWVTVSLADVRASAHRHHTTINDVVLAAVTGGFRQLLLERHEDVEGCELQALVPVSTHTPDLEGSYGNHVSAMVAPLPIGAASGPERLARITRAMGRHKGRHQADGAELLLESLELLPAALLAPATRFIHRQPLFNVIVTNVPGPQVPLYFLGARMLEAIPVVPLGGNLTVSIGVLSYDGQLTVGLLADRATCPDLAVLTQGIRDGFDELVAARPRRARTHTRNRARSDAESKAVVR